jgi:hypothetical protein
MRNKQGQNFVMLNSVLSHWNEELVASRQCGIDSSTIRGLAYVPDSTWLWRGIVHTMPEIHFENSKKIMDYLI